MVVICGDVLFFVVSVFVDWYYFVMRIAFSVLFALFVFNLVPLVVYSDVVVDDYAVNGGVQGFVVDRPAYRGFGVRYEDNLRYRDFHRSNLLSRERLSGLSAGIPRVDREDTYVDLTLGMGLNPDWVRLLIYFLILYLFAKFTLKD